MTIGCKVYVEDNHDLTYRYIIEILKLLILQINLFIEELMKIKMVGSSVMFRRIYRGYSNF